LTTQTITFTSSPPASPTVGGSYTVSATGGGSGNPVTFSIDSSSTSGACSISGATVSFNGVGTCVIDANQAGTSTYSTAPQVQQSLTIAAAALTTQTITFTSSPPASPTVGGSYTVSATGGGSGNPVTFSIDSWSTSGACSISGATVSFKGVGTCVIDANQAAAGSYPAAPQVQESLTIAAAPPAGGNCASPVFSTSGAEGITNTDPSPAPENWWVQNDAWNRSHGPQTLYVCNQSSWYAVSNQPNNGGAVETYPDTEYDIGGRNSPSTTPISGWKSITSTFSEAYPAAGGWDAAYDLWLNNWSTEIMIWNQWAGSNAHWPEQATTSLTLDGVPYTFYDNGGEFNFFRGTQTASGSVDILAALQWLVSQGLVNATAVPTQLEYGVEISYTSGSETFPTTGLTFSLSS
jgi:hypothetical protein